MPSYSTNATVDDNPFLGKLHQYFGRIKDLYSKPSVKRNLKELDEWEKYILKQDRRILLLNPPTGQHIGRLIYIYRDAIARLRTTFIRPTPEDERGWMRELSHLITESSFTIDTLSEITANEDITEINKLLGEVKSKDVKLLDVRGDYILRTE